MNNVINEPRISISVKEGCINVGRSVVRALSSPEYIRVLKSEKGDSLAIQTSSPTDVMSFKVPEHFMEDKDVKLRIISTPFCRDIFELNNLDLDKTYIISGEVLADFSTVIFNIAKAKLAK